METTFDPLTQGGISVFFSYIHVETRSSSLLVDVKVCLRNYPGCLIYSLCSSHDCFFFLGGGGQMKKKNTWQFAQFAKFATSKISQHLLTSKVKSGATLRVAKISFFGADFWSHEGKMLPFSCAKLLRKLPGQTWQKNTWGKKTCRTPMSFFDLVVVFCYFNEINWLLWRLTLRSKNGFCEGEETLKQFSYVRSSKI